MPIEKANAVIAETLGYRLEEVKPEQHLCYDLLADSLALTELFINLESAFGVKFQKSDLEKMNYVKDIYPILCKRGLGSVSSDPQK